MGDGGASRGALRREVLRGIAEGRPRRGPLDVHIDVTNGCNAACVTCWDHSPLLRQARPSAWKRRRLDLDRFEALVEDLAGMGSVQAVVLSGMGEPLTHPDIYRMMAAIKARGWQLTLMTNLVAADPERLLECRVDNLVVGVQGASPGSYTAFHPGWTEAQFFTLCRLLRRLAQAGSKVRHVHVIDRHTAPELVEMVRLGQLFRAERVTLKLASLAGGTEAVRISAAQRAWLLEQGIPAAAALARELGVSTNLPLFEAQVRAGAEAAEVTTPMDEVGCYMGHVYTRVTVDGAVLYCCNTEIEVGHLEAEPLSRMWWGPTWQGLRERIAAGQWFPGCARCGKFEQNLKWAERVRAVRP